MWYNSWSQSITNLWVCYGLFSTFWPPAISAETHRHVRPHPIGCHMKLETGTFGTQQTATGAIGVSVIRKCSRIWLRKRQVNPGCCESSRLHGTASGTLAWFYARWMYVYRHTYVYVCLYTIYIYMCVYRCICTVILCIHICICIDMMRVYERMDVYTVSMCLIDYIVYIHNIHTCVYPVPTCLTTG